MDGDRFDALTRSLASKANRRQTLKAFAAGILGGAGGVRSVLDADAQDGQVDVCYQTGNPRKPFHFLRLDPRGAARLKDRRGFVVCDEDEVLDRETCTCVPPDTEPAPPSEPETPACLAVGEECRRNGECCSHWCSRGICQCTGSGANCADQFSGEVGVCYLTGRRFKPSVYFTVSPFAAARLKGRRGYVVCDEGELLDADTCICEPDLGGEEPGPSCSPVGGTCQDNGDCCGDGSPCENGICQCATTGSGCEPTNDCCSGLCDGGVCQCAGPSVACTTDQSCCGGSCVDGTCACLPAGADCGGDGECCSGACVGGACLCAAPDTVCQAASDCCSGVCVNGRCGCTAGNCPAGKTCYEGVCCTPDCTGKTCGGDGCGETCGPCCELGVACQADDDCCSHACVDGTCGCAAPGTSCEAAVDCCSFNCQGGLCTCVEAGSACQTNADCCSDICLDGGICACQQGDCPAGQICHNLTCCAPNCPEGTECGDDGCGGVCGTCGTGEVCCARIQSDFDFCTVATCTSQDQEWCLGSSGECCVCVTTTEGTVACVSEIDWQSTCSSSQNCQSGYVCTSDVTGSNACSPLCSS